MVYQAGPGLSVWLNVIHLIPGCSGEHLDPCAAHILQHSLSSPSSSHLSWLMNVRVIFKDYYKSVKKRKGRGRNCMCIERRCRSCDSKWRLEIPCSFFHAGSSFACPDTHFSLCSLSLPRRQAGDDIRGYPSLLLPDSTLLWQTAFSRFLATAMVPGLIWLSCALCLLQVLSGNSLPSC